jgi:DNA replication licensing factor MCM5
MEHVVIQLHQRSHSSRLSQYLFTHAGNYRLGAQRYIYREKLLRMHRRLANDEGNNNQSNNLAMLEIDVAHLGEYDGSLLGYLREQPATILPAMELAASDALDTLLYDLRKETQEDDEEDAEGGNTNNTTKKQEERLLIQILLKGNLSMTPLRSIKSEHMNRLIKCPGIVISAAPVRCRAVQLVVRCPRCLDTQKVSATEGPFGSVLLPNRCQGPNPQECGSNPYTVVPDESQFCDRQTLKLQEAPEKVPTGEMPRAVLSAVERNLVDKAPPGTRVSVFCIPSLFTKGGIGKEAPTRQVYLRVVGLIKDHQSGDSAQYTPAEEEAFSQLARRPDVFEIMSRSVAPSISGSYTVDIKKALVCMLMGGTRKRLPDGMRLRGDINVLLLGDPSTAKSQFLKFVSKTSPIGIYTSGKGSSAAGLTASVVKDSRGEFYLEGGAMVLADGGIVCIDEFDKMRPADRVAIHEAMEQQTISIAKAGITTVLNSRSAVLAAANPVFGRYDDNKSASEQIDLMTTILSRFDLIFLVRDVREEERDRMICRHVMGIHINNAGTSSGDGADGSLSFLSAANAFSEEGGNTERYVSSRGFKTISKKMYSSIMFRFVERNPNQILQKRLRRTSCRLLLLVLANLMSLL